MKHAELLEDPESLERGEQLVALYIEGLTQLRLQAPSEMDRSRNFNKEIRKVVKNAIEIDNTDSGAFEVLGRNIADLRQRQIAVRDWQNRGEVGTEEWRRAYQPAMEFLDAHAGKPIVAEDMDEPRRNIHTYRSVFSEHPRKIAGFIIPKIIGNSQLKISRRPDSTSLIAKLQIFDRIHFDRDDTDVNTYGSGLRIAIGH
jgi:hypothetical protein